KEMLFIISFDGSVGLWLGTRSLRLWFGRLWSGHNQTDETCTQFLSGLVEHIKSRDVSEDIIEAEVVLMKNDLSIIIQSDLGEQLQIETQRQYRSSNSPDCLQDNGLS